MLLKIDRTLSSRALRFVAKAVQREQETAEFFPLGDNRFAVQREVLNENFFYRGFL